ncbi:hypothetical protein ACWENO_34980 [Streptomyces sp. NPDC004436]
MVTTAPTCTFRRRTANHARARQAGIQEIVYHQRFRSTDFRLLRVVFSHETLHQDPQVKDNEELIATTLHTAHYGQLPPLKAAASGGFPHRTVLKAQHRADGAVEHPRRPQSAAVGTFHRKRAARRRCHLPRPHPGRQETDPITAAGDMPAARRGGLFHYHAPHY